MKWKIGTVVALAAVAAVPLSSADASSNTITACESSATNVTILKGDNQSAVITTPYAEGLQVIVTDSNNNNAPVLDCPVTMTVVRGSNGAGAIFSSNGRTSITHHTGKSSGKLKEGLLANAVAGPFTVTATVNNTSVSATFSETNLPARASASIVPTSISEHLGQCAKFYYYVNIKGWNTVAIYGPKGRRWRFFKEGWQSAGVHAQQWCGGTGVGTTKVPAGVYTLRLAVRPAASLTAPIVASASKQLTVKS